MDYIVTTKKYVLINSLCVALNPMHNGNIKNRNKYWIFKIKIKTLHFR